MQNRNHIRQQIKLKRQQLSADFQHTAAIKLVQKITQFKIFQSAQHIAGYIAHEGEIDVLPVLQIAWQKHKSCYLPVIASRIEKKLTFVHYQAETKLQKNDYGLLEPIHNNENTAIAVTALDLILLPLLAFDKQGNRLGTGSGYYDRALEFLKTQPRPTKPFLLGVAYAWQQVDAIEQADWDIPLDAVATDEAIILP